VETVDEDELVAAIEWLMTREGVVAEPAGAAATAALLSDNPRSGTIVVLVTGANLAPAVLRLVARA
jgi:threonine dehydratase